MTAAQLLSLLDKTLHQMRVIDVNDYGETNHIAICSCSWESVQMTSRAEAQAFAAAGCPIKLLDDQAARRRAAREQRERVA
jgi:hypothetical protein